MSGEVARLPIARNSDVLFYREPVLPPGVYTMETVVYDNPSKKASVRYSTVQVPSIDPKKLRISSLVLVDRGEQVPAGEPKDGPLFVKDVLIYPNLTGEVSKSAKAARILLYGISGHVDVRAPGLPRRDPERHAAGATSSTARPCRQFGPHSAGWTPAS